MKRTHRSTRDRWSRYFRPTMGERLASLAPWLRTIPLLILAVSLVTVTSVLADVTTDQPDYAPGSVVTISGGNSDGAGYLPGETVHVDVSGPNGYAASCEAVADEAGAWSCQVTLWDSELAEGGYTYTATGLTSGVTQTGSFTDHGSFPATASAFSIAKNASHLVTVGVTLTLPESSTATLTAATAKVENVTDGGTTDVALTGPGGNGSGSWSGSFQGLCGKTYKINNVTVTWHTTSHTADHQNTVTPAGTVQVTTDACAPSNTAPTVAFNNPPTSADEGDTKTFDFDITDTAGDTFSFVSGFPDCGSEGTLVASSESINNTTQTGTFQCLFPDGLDPAVDSTVRVQVQDQGPLASNIDTTDVTVYNVDPSVDAPSFQPATINCRNSVTLTGISFSDPGVNDDDWNVNIDWGDGSADTSYDTDMQGDQDDQSHQYNTPGTYTATVTVTDKDGGEGSSSDTLVVNQTYTGTWKQPINPNTNTLNSVVNTTKLGRVVPLKVTLVDDCTLAPIDYTSGKDVSVRVYITLTATQVLTDAIEVYADAGEANNSTFCFRWTDGFWLYNLDTSNKGSFGALTQLYTYSARVQVADDAESDGIVTCSRSSAIEATPDALLKMMK